MAELFLDSTSKRRNGRRQFGCTALTNSLCVSVWFTLLSLQLGLLEAISENTRPTHRCCSASRPEKDFLVTERIRFPCRNLGKRQKSGQLQTSLSLISLISLAQSRLKHHVMLIMNSQFFQLVQSRERPIHVFNGPGDFIILEIPFRKETKADRIVKKSTPRKQLHWRC